MLGICQVLAQLWCSNIHVEGYLPHELPAAPTRIDELVVQVTARQEMGMRGCSNQMVYILYLNLQVKYR